MFWGLFILLLVLFYCSNNLFVLFFSNRSGLYNYFLAVVGWYSFLVSNSLLACKLPINESVEWRHHLNQSYFAHLWCIFGLPLVGLFARLLMVSLRWCFTWLVSLFCFCAFLTWFLCFVFYAANSFLPCKLAINHRVEWRHLLNLRYFAHLLCTVYNNWLLLHFCSLSYSLASSFSSSSVLHFLFVSFLHSRCDSVAFVLFSYICFFFRLFGAWLTLLGFFEAIFHFL